MGDFRLRDTRKLYPSAISEMQKPVPGGSIHTWEQIVAHCLGAGASGLSGGIVNGKLICSGDWEDLNTWMYGPP